VQVILRDDIKAEAAHFLRTFIVSYTTRVLMVAFIIHIFIFFVITT
jgi:hypothetical protein